MKKHRKKYFLSDKYRKTIKIGEECIVHDINGISSHRKSTYPKRVTISGNSKSNSWLTANGDTEKGLTFGYSLRERPIANRLLLVRECDLTRKELAELIAIKLKNAVQS